MFRYMWQHGKPSICQQTIVRRCIKMSTNNLASSEVQVNDTNDGIAMPEVLTVRVPFKNSFARVAYADLGPSDGPICVTIHGAPGGIADTLDMAEPLNTAGIRLIIPEFPGYGRTSLEDESVYDHTTEARTELMKNFLAAIHVSRIAAVVGHSMGAAAAVSLAANTDLCRSLVSVNGVGIVVHRSLKPIWQVQTLANSLENSWTGPIIARLLTSLYSLRGFNIQTGEFSADSMKVSVISATRIQFDKLLENATRLREKRLPMLFATAKNDKLVEWQVPVATAKHCGTDESRFTWFDADENVVEGPSPDDLTVGYPRAYVFDRGGHVVHRAHRDIICRSIVNLVNFVSSRPQ